MNAESAFAGPQPHSYHLEIRDFLKRHEPELWNWFAGRRGNPEAIDQLRLELLKQSYRVDAEHQPQVYEVTREVARVLGLDVPITIYRHQNSAGLNASLAYLPGEVHLVFHGPIETQLEPRELRALVGHELTHFLLFELDNGDFHTAEQLLSACAEDAGSHPAFAASWRLQRLYTEIVCDRGAELAVGDPSPVIATLLKLETGSRDIHAESYLRQVAEILKQEQQGTAGVTHPESFIRAHAIQLWGTRDPSVESQIARLIEGEPGPTELDLLGQARVATATRRLIEWMLGPPWMRTPAVLAHARMFFDDFEPPGETGTEGAVADEPLYRRPRLADYFSFVLLDFVTVDPSLDRAPLALGLSMAGQLGFGDRFRELAMQELKLGKKLLQTIDRDRQTLLNQAQEEHAAGTAKGAVT